VATIPLLSSARTCELNDLQLMLDSPISIPEEKAQKLEHRRNTDIEQRQRLENKCNTSTVNGKLRG
jgi:hypothetical protein